MRWFRLLFGNTAYAASATLCAFFAGMAIGAALGGRISSLVTRPLKAYAALEAGTALTALLVPLAVLAYEPLYAAMYDDWVDQRAGFTAIKFGLAFIAVLPTSMLLGATLPVLGSAFVGTSGRLASRGGGLYAVNTLGAALGSGLGALWLPEALGVRATYACAMALSLCVAGAALWLTRSPEAVSPQPPIERDSKQTRAALRWRLVAFSSGFGTLALEVLLIHALALSLENSVYSFGAVLIVVLLSLAAGAGTVAYAASRTDVRSWLTPVLWAQSAVLLVLPFAIVLGTSGFEINRAATFANGIGLAFAFGGVPLLLGGLVLPLTFRRAEDGSRHGVGRRLGGLLSANTLGGIVGSAAASFVLLDWLGLWLSIVAIAASYALVALLLTDTRRGRALGTAAIALVAVSLASGGVAPENLPLTKFRKRERIVAMKEGAHGVVSVIDVLKRSGPPDRRLRLNNHYTLSGALAKRHQRRLGELPLVLHGSAKRALYIGTATGETASAAVTHPLEDIVLVELVPEVQEFAAVHFAEANLGVYSDPRTRVVVEDGRNHLRAVPERYDTIVTDLLVPWRPGVSSLYTRDHFEAARDHLAPSGVFCLWLPLYQLDRELFDILATTMLEVFPETSVWRGDFFERLPTVALVAFNGPPPTREEIEVSVGTAAQRGSDDRWIADPEGFWMLHIGALAAATAPGSLTHTDDHPIFEYVAGRSTAATRRAFRTQEWPARVEALLRAPEAVGVIPTPPSSRVAAHAMIRGFRSLASKSAEERRRASAMLRAAVPSQLLEVPDNSVAERWPGRPRD